MAANILLSECIFSIVYLQMIIEDRLNVVKSERNVEKIEEKINCGQVEELLIQGERELALARAMLQWRPWEPLIEEAPQNQWKWPPS